MGPNTIEGQLKVLTKLQRLADDWRHIPAADYNRQHDEITTTIDRLLDEATTKKP